MMAFGRLPHFVVLMLSAIIIHASEKKPLLTVHERAVRGVYFCNDIEFRGACNWVDQSIRSGACQTLEGTENYKLVASIRPDPGVHCWAFDGDHCDGMSLGNITYPGYCDLVELGWNDRIGSYKCNA